MIKLKNISFQYEQDDGAACLEDISFHIPAGSCVVLCGPSGCGKTTLLRLISGLAPSAYPGNLSGDITVKGKRPAELSSADKAATTGMVFQDPRSQFFMSDVLNEISFSGENLGKAPQWIRNKIDELSARLGLTDLIDRNLDTLSSGQKQKVAIASACLLNPPLLILDEPTANLDKAGADALVQMLLEVKRGGTTILISEHRLHNFLPVADQYICINKGRLAGRWSRDEFSQLSCTEAAHFGLRHPDMASGTPCNTPIKNELHCFVADQIYFHFPSQAQLLNNLSFFVELGSVTAFVGENGAGKTTMGKIMCGLIRPSTGRVLYNGKAMTSRKRNMLSYFVMQDADYQLYAESVGNEIVLGRKLTNTVRERAYRAMDLFGLTLLKDRHPASLSGGEKQRVSLAAAYCSDAKLIVLDEPTSGLDAENVKRVAQYIKELSSENRAVVVITHDDILINLTCNKVICI